MPELPEVETVVRILNSSQAGDVLIKKVIVHNDKILKNSTPKIFENFIINEKIIHFSRIGKYILVHLSNEKIILIHLRMEGKLFCEDEKFRNYTNDSASNEFSKSHPPLTHLRIEIQLNNGFYLNFYDMRIFGTFHILYEKDLTSFPELTRVAIDPLDTKFNVDYLFNKLKNSNKSIKTFLLEQKNVSGIGNIYVDEILFSSHIHPLSTTKKITPKLCESIVSNAKKILNEAISYGGTTFATFASGENSIGHYQTKLKVYGKENEKCPNCGNVIKKIFVNGRGTHFCEECQFLYK